MGKPPHNAPTPETLALAAALVGEAGIPDREIAALLGIAPRTLVRWKQRPDMVLALAAVRLFAFRAQHRGQGWRWHYDDLGPRTPSLFERR